MAFKAHQGIDFGLGLSIGKGVFTEAAGLHLRGGALTIASGGLTISADGLDVTGTTTLDTVNAAGPMTVTRAGGATAATGSFTNTTSAQSSVRALDLGMDDGAAGEDNDQVYMSFTLGDDTQVQVEAGRIGGILTDVSGSADGAIRFSAPTAGTMTDIMQIGFNTAGTFVYAIGDAVGTPAIQAAFTLSEATSDFTLDDTETTLNNQQVLRALIFSLQANGIVT